MTAMVRQISTAACGVFLLAATGCVASRQPLSDDKTSQPDARLLGAWEFTDEEGKEKTTVEVAIKKDSPNVLELSGDEDGQKKSIDLYTIKIGDGYYASMGENDDEGKLKYVICKYELVDDAKLNLWALDTDFFAAAVDTKELNGKVKQELFKDVLLDETPENLRKFIEKHGDKCFSKETPVQVKRIKKDD